MRKITWLIILISVIVTSPAYAYNFISPKKGEGPVQIAERIGVSPKKFIALNLELGNFKYPKKVSLIYMGQKFAIPSSSGNKSVIKIEQGCKKPVKQMAYTQPQQKKVSSEACTVKTNKVQKLDSQLEGQINEVISSIESHERVNTGATTKVTPKLGSSNKLILAALTLGTPLTFFLIRFFIKRREVDHINETDETDNDILKATSSLVNTQDIPKKWSFLGSNKDHIFVCCCLSTGNFMVVHGGSSYQSEHGGKEGLEEVFHFIKTVYGEEATELVKFEVPNCYADSYRSLTSEERLL